MRTSDVEGKRSSTGFQRQSPTNEGGIRNTGLGDEQRGFGAAHSTASFQHARSDLAEAAEDCVR
jgi:hypothetical protein